MTTTEPVATQVSTRRLRIHGYGVLALLAYVPVLLTKPGKVVADTKTYLYLDPGRLLERAVSMWETGWEVGPSNRPSPRRCNEIHAPCLQHCRLFAPAFS